LRRVARRCVARGAAGGDGDRDASSDGNYYLCALVKNERRDKEREKVPRAERKETGGGGEAEGRAAPRVTRCHGRVAYVTMYSARDKTAEIDSSERRATGFAGSSVVRRLLADRLRDRRRRRIYRVLSPRKACIFLAFLNAARPLGIFR
jgi:hypothetical protein